MERSDKRFDISMAATTQGVWTTLTWGLLVFAAPLPIDLLRTCLVQDHETYCVMGSSSSQS